jgi:exportin-T
MAQQQSTHLTDIPQAIQIAAATDPSVDPALKQQALDYLQKVKERCDETWQVSPQHRMLREGGRQKQRGKSRIDLPRCAHDHTHLALSAFGVRHDPR